MRAEPEVNDVFDIAIVGSGFAGSLLAMIAARLGRSVVLVERGRHPRFAIGESSTPLANLLLEELARRYDLPRVAPLSKWGTWQASYPGLASGLKRGFTFFHHRPGESRSPALNRCDQLLVAASLDNAVGDTHWYRSDLDAFLVREAQDAGITYLDEVNLTAAARDGRIVTLHGDRGGNLQTVRARFVVDASGPRGFLHRILKLDEREFQHMPSTQSLYSHFQGVERFWPDSGADAPPYPPDDAAVHHVFDGGWAWMLRFNNGITSAGVAATDSVADRMGLRDGEPGWHRLLERLPALGETFRDASALRPFTYVPRLAFRFSEICGDWWAMLPSAAGFIDPLLSTGIPLTFLGVVRLAEIIARADNRDRLQESLRAYSRSTLIELDATAHFIAALYAGMRDFDVFTNLCMLYFAATSFAETSLRMERREAQAPFLMQDHPQFAAAFARCCDSVLSRHGRFSDQERQDLHEQVVRAIEPINIAGLADPSRRNWYGVEAGDLSSNARKLGVNAGTLLSTLRRQGLMLST